MPKTIVYIVQSEKPYQSSVDSVRSFDTEEDAEAFIIKYNERQKRLKISNWCMYATMNLHHSVAVKSSITRAIEQINA